MNEHLKDPFFDFHAHLKLLPDHVLRDLARNDCAGWDYRKHAVEVLHVRKSPMVYHPDLKELHAELEAELDGLIFDHPDLSVTNAPNLPSLQTVTGPLVASVTTATMFSDGPVAELSTVDLDLSTDHFLAADEVTGAELNDILDESRSDTDQPTVDEAPASSGPIRTKPKRTYTKKPKEIVDASPAD